MVLTRSRAGSAPQGLDSIPQPPEVCDMAATRPSVGFVGLGHMGGSMAARFLAAGYPLFGEARTRNNAQGLIDDGMSESFIVAPDGSSVGD